MTRALAVGALLLAVSALPAAAVCNSDDLRGVWRYYSQVGVHNDAGLTLLVTTDRCRVTVDDDDTVSLARCSYPGLSLYELDWTGQQPNVLSNCVFTIATEFCFYHGTLARNKITASGVGYCSTFDELSFDLVKE